MQKWQLIVFFLFIICQGGDLRGLETNQVTADVQWNSIQENTPFTVTIQVTHDAQDKVDEGSFESGGKKITPKYLGSVSFTPPSTLRVSTYEFQMPGMVRGLQILPVISVKIGGKKYESIPSGFEVQGPDQAKSKVPALKLQGIFTGTEPMYPGQTFLVGYKYLYNRSIDLAEEILPLLEAKGFKKIGDKKIDSGQEGAFTFTQVLQKVQATEAGSYNFGPSKVAGFVYTQDAQGAKQYVKPALQSEMGPLRIEVAPFPTANRPGSFNGAIGQYTFDAKLKSSPKVQEGDKIQLLLTVTGKGDLEQLLPPELCCQPGFSGNFKTGDLPPVAEIKGDTKTFLIDLEVQNSEIQAVPPIEFSFFDPSKKTYQKILSKEIPLQVEPKSLPTLPPSSPYPYSSLETLPLQDAPSTYSIPVSPLLLISLGLAALVLQSHYMSEKRKARPSEPLSKLLFWQAQKEGSYSLMEKAIRQTLLEKKVISKLNDNLEEIPEPYQEVLKALERKQFAQGEITNEIEMKINEIFA